MFALLPAAKLAFHVFNGPTNVVGLGCIWFVERRCESPDCESTINPEIDIPGSPMN
jgi:hypothetical protein